MSNEMLKGSEGLLLAKQQLEKKNELKINNNAKEIKPPEKPKKTLKIMSSHEYFNSGIGKSKGWLVNRLIPKAGVGVLAGAEKSCKSTIAYNIALSVATGCDCLAHETVETGKVLYILVEGSLDPSMEAFGISDNIDVLPDFYFQFEELKDLLIEEIEEKGYKLIVIDSLYKATSANISVANEIRKVLIDLESIATKYDTTFLLCHHTMRGTSNTDEDTKSDDLAGSKDIGRAATFNIYLKVEKPTDEDRLIYQNLTDEEIDNLPKKRILKKENYRYGGEGWDKYNVDIHFKKSKIIAKRYNSQGVRETPDTRDDDLYNHACELLETFDRKFSKTDLCRKLAIRYPALKEETIRQKYIEKLITRLVKNDKIIKLGERSFKSNILTIEQVEL